MNLFVKLFVKIASFVSSLFPRQFLRASGSWVGFLWFDIFKIRRKIIMDNLNIAFPDMSEDQKLAIGRSSVYLLGHNFGEMFDIPNMNQKWLDKNVIFEGQENLDKARAQGKGILFLTLHLGNGDVCANAVVMEGLPVHMITKRFKTKWFDDLWFSVRGAKGVQYIDAHSPNNAFEILKALKKKEAVVFVLDQYMGKPFGIASTFFGKRTGTAYGLALFAQKTKAPVVPCYTYEGSDKKLHTVFEPAMDLERYVVDDKDQTTSNFTQAFNDKLESIVRKHPEQWMWVHRRWKDFK